MSKLNHASAERMADHFAAYLAEEYAGSRHVLRIASWLGFVVKGIQQLAQGSWRIPRTRQLRFEHGGQSYKARYNHQITPRGGIEFLEILPGRGAPDGPRVLTISSLAEAERFYRNPKTHFP